jgi:5'-3' exonuclease
MGIEAFIPWLKDFCPKALGLFPLKQLKGFKVAIDAHYWCYTNVAIATREAVNKMSHNTLDLDRNELFKIFAKMFFDFTLSWLNNNIDIVFIFDGGKKYNAEGGVNLSAEKIKTILERREKRKEIADKIAASRENIMKTDELLRPPLIIAHKELLKKLVTVLPEEIEKLKELMTAAGLEWIQAKYDAEQLCSMLARESKVRAVFSGDTDNIVYGCPLLIREFEYHNISGEKVKMCTYVDFPTLLQELAKNGVSYEMFRDFCILCKCDYNEKIAGIGPKTAFKLIKAHGSIEGIEKVGAIKDIKPLNHIVCRSIFTEVKSDSLIVNLYKDTTPSPKYETGDTKDNKSLGGDQKMVVKSKPPQQPWVFSDNFYTLLWNYGLTQYKQYLNVAYESLSNYRSTASHPVIVSYLDAVNQKLEYQPKIKLNILTSNGTIQSSNNEDKKSVMVKLKIQPTTNEYQQKSSTAFSRAIEHTPIADPLAQLNDILKGVHLIS